MIEKLIEWSVRNRFVVLAAAAVLAVAGVYATLHTPVDAIPDLSENQVIVFTDWPGRSPREIEDQVTYPLSLRLQGLAGIKAVRSSSEFNFSMITLIFEEKTDFYFARQRVLERLTQAPGFLPAGVVPYLAPDATALGQILWYTVEPSPGHPVDPGRLWALNKFYIAPQLNAAGGVSEVAPVGGTPLEYQVDVSPETLRAYGVTVGELYAAVSRSNQPAGGGVIQKNNAEYLVRGVGWIKDKADIENTVIKEVNGTPVYVRTVATVQLGTQFRRSVFEKDGSEVVGGVVLMRHGENPLAVTGRVKAKVEELQPGLPDGVRIVPAYDRTRLITGAIHTLAEVMWHEMLIATLAILLILVHVRSAFVICVTLPLAVLFSFLLMFVLRKLGIIDIQANIMSLAGITISIGVLVDQAIVMVENATHHLKEKFGDKKVTGDTREVVIKACRTVGRPIFFSVLIMLLSFVPVFMLSGREGKYFHPLAFTKSFALLGVALISVTVVPALIPSFIRGRLKSEEDNWIVRSFIHIYKPLLTWALPRRNLVMWAFAALLILAAGLFPVQALVGFGASETAWRAMFLLTFAVVTTLTVGFTRGWVSQLLSLGTLVALALVAFHFPKIGVSFMPALDEGTTLDMPVTVPRASVTQVADDLKARNALLRGFPEVESVVGKAGRADTPTDPAPLDMVETFVNFRPRGHWPKRVLRFQDADRETRAVLDALVARGFLVVPPHADDRDALVNEAAQKALERFDETMREFALRRYTDFESDLGPSLLRFVVEDTLRHMRAGGFLGPLSADDERKLVDDLLPRLAPDEAQGFIKRTPPEAITQQMHVFGSFLAHLKQSDVQDRYGTSASDFLKEIRRNPVPMTTTEAHSAAHANRYAAQYVVGLGNKLGATLGRTLIEADADLDRDLR
ncbi:MAG: efflux RND transporter permease subunit, partial [Gemmataceae bacterium]